MSAVENFGREHWFLSFLLAAFAIGSFSSLVYAVLFRLPNRLLRHLNIRKAGWPPVHCDADGDFRKEAQSEGDL